MIEIVCCTPADALIAQEGGATQIELCVAIELGGLTPTKGLVRAVKQSCHLPVMAMLRPRPGSFVCSEDEFRVMEMDAQDLLEAGADGLVFGMLREDGTIDSGRCKLLRSQAEEVQCIFHRAFDQVPDQSEALETLIDLGFDRVLTSGGKSLALEGAATMRDLHAQSRDRIQILPGGRIRPNNARELLDATDIRRLHLAPIKSDGDTRWVDGEAVRAVSAILRQYCGTVDEPHASPD